MYLLILGAVVLFGVILYFVLRNKEEETQVGIPTRDIPPTSYKRTASPHRASSVSRTSRPSSNTDSGGIGLLETVIIADMLTHHDHHTVSDEHHFSGGESGGAGANGDFDDRDKFNNSDNYNTDNNDSHDHSDHSDYSSDSSDYGSSDSSSYDSGGSDFGGSND